MGGASIAQDTLIRVPYVYTNTQLYQANAIVKSQYDYYWMAGQTDTIGTGNSNVYLMQIDPNNGMDTVRIKIYNFYKDVSRPKIS